ncbi:hypothetical protein [Arthrobacter sedimenti]|uniref:Uncharacterized protein n=1 Tax=Arthrobacter sedimenti TaxID=2694931 RepID=A0ABV8WHS5_9MICC
MRRTIWSLAAAFVTTIVFGSVYVTLQQIGRHEANIAPAAAASAQVQQTGSDIMTAPRLELTPDSGLFLIEYGQNNTPLSTSVTLHGSVPVIPDGVLETARAQGTDTVTWQPEPGLPMAVVAKHTAGKVVVAGQSLAPFEASDSRALAILAAGWLGSMSVLAGSYGALRLLERRQAGHHND